MSEFERLIHLLASLQILFFTRRGGGILVLLLVILGGGGWLAYRTWFDAAISLEKADLKWDTGETVQRISAIRDYKSLLRRRDPIEAELPWLRLGRDRLYRRIIEHHVLFDVDAPEARDWIYAAWKENIRDLDFHDERVNAFWLEITEEIKSKQKSLGPLGGVLSGR